MESRGIVFLIRLDFAKIRKIIENGKWRIENEAAPNN
jgi:hypothetical protein